MILKLDKISFKEALNNDNGRTSSKKIIGVLSSFVCLFLMTALIIFYFWHTADAVLILQFFDKIITVFGISAGLLGVKSIANAISNRHVVTSTCPPVAAPPVQEQPVDTPDNDDEPRPHKKRTTKKKKQNEVSDAYQAMVDTPEEEIDA